MIKEKFLRKSLIIILCILVLTLCVACNGYVDESIEDVDVVGITLNVTQLDIFIDDCFTITANVYPNNATVKRLLWTTSNEDVVTVTQTGYVTGISVGTAIITATSINNKKAVCVVNVLGEVFAESVGFDIEEKECFIGDEFIITSTVLPENVTDKTLTWSSSNENVATVVDGKVSALATGTAIINAVANNGIRAFCTVRVIRPIVEVEEITLNFTSLNCRVGDIINLIATVLPLDADDKSLTWDSSDYSVVKVASGVVLAYAKGNAVVTASSTNGVSASCVINVDADNNEVDVEDIILDKDSVNCIVGDINIVEFSVLPTNATNKDLDWCSSNVSVATVDGGIITAVGVGECTITVSSNNGVSKSVSVVVDVIHVTNITLSYSELSLCIGDEFEIFSTVIPNNAFDKGVVWASSNTDVVTVDNGRIVAVGEGYAVVLVTSYDNSISAECRIEVNALRKFDCELNSKIFVFDGEPKELIVDNIPDEASVVYENNTQTNVGLYKVCATISKVGYETLILTADLRIVKSSYNINYVLNLDGVINLNPIEYTTFAEPRFVPLSCDYYDFLGLYTDKELTERIEEIPYGSYEDFTLYAKWEKSIIVEDNKIVGISEVFQMNVTNLVIPEVLYGTKITEISKNAFSCCERLNSVLVSKEIENIDDEAFERCYELESVVFSSNSKLIKIGSCAFNACGKLKKFKVPNGVEEVGSLAFDGCDSLEYITIPSTVLMIPATIILNNNDIIIYCEIPNQPSTWSMEWSGDATVHWNYDVSSII